MKRRILSLILALAMLLSSSFITAFADGEMTEPQIVDAAFALETGKSLDGTFTLTGVVSQILTPYDEGFANVTVNMTVLDGTGAERTIQCYRMKGDDAATVEVGDTIAVTGKIKNYKGTVEFDTGCTFETVSKASGAFAIKTFAGYASGDVALLVRQEGKTTIESITGKDYNAYALIVCNADGKVIDLDLRGPGRPAGVKGDYEIPAGGFIIGINRDVTGYPIKVVEEAFVLDGIEKGSRIKLYGVDLADLAETANGTALTASFNVLERLPETEAEILAAAFALEAGGQLEGTYSLTGKVTEKTDTNRQVKIAVADKEILCFKMVEADYNAVAVDDIITVTGVLKNYQGTVEYDTGCTAVIVQAAAKDELPEGAIAIDYAGYKHAAFVSILAGDGQTVAELTARGNNGAAKDLNYAYNILVDKDGVVIGTDYVLKQACTFVIPEGGYIISYNANKEGYAVMTNIRLGDTITLYNVNAGAVATVNGNVALESAGFTYTAHAHVYKEVEDKGFIFEECEICDYRNPDSIKAWDGSDPIDITVSHVNAYSWGVFDSIICSTAGKTVEELTGQKCTWWIVYTVELVDGKWVATGFSKNVDANGALVVPEGGFLWITYSKYPSYTVADEGALLGYYFYPNWDFSKGMAVDTSEHPELVQHMYVSAPEPTYDPSLFEGEEWQNAEWTSIDGVTTGSWQGGLKGDQSYDFIITREDDSIVIALKYTGTIMTTAGAVGIGKNGANGKATMFRALFHDLSAERAAFTTLIDIGYDGTRFVIDRIGDYIGSTGNLTAEQIEAFGITFQQAITAENKFELLINIPVEKLTLNGGDLEAIVECSYYGASSEEYGAAIEPKNSNLCLYCHGYDEDGKYKASFNPFISENAIALPAPVEPITENILDLGEEKVVGVVTFTADNPNLETIRVSGSVDGENYYDLNCNGNVAVTDGVATLDIHAKGFIQVRYIKVEGTDVHGTIALAEPELPEGAIVVEPQGPYPMTGLNNSKYGIVYFTAADAPEGFGVNATDVFTNNGIAVDLKSCIITIAQKVDNGVYKILWNDCNAWNAELHQAMHVNEPEGVEGIDYHDDKVFLAEDQIVFIIWSSGGYGTANDGVNSTAKWVLRGMNPGEFLRLTEDTAEFHKVQPEAVPEPVDPLEPEAYLWAEATSDVIPILQFKLPVDDLNGSAFHIAALVKFENIEGTLAYVNAYAWDAEGGYIKHSDFANQTMATAGKWALIEADFNPFDVEGKTVGIVTSEIGFWQATGKIYVGSITVTQGDDVIWSKDFEYGLDLDDPDIRAISNITAENKGTVWDVVGAKEKPIEEPEPYEATVIVADNAILTDGKTGFDGAWGTVGTGDVLLVTNAECKTAPMVVTIIDELDELKAIKKVSLDLYHDANVMIGYPEGKATVYVSADGETYTSVGEFDLAAADLALGSHGTVSNVFEFDATEAKFVKIVLNAGSNAAVLGESPADGKVNWEFISIAEIAVEGEEESEPVQPETLETVPEDAIVIDYAGYKHAGVVSILAGDGQTVAELTARGNNGTAKDLNYAYNILVNADNIVIATDYALSVACTFEVPEGGYIISYNGNKSGYAVMADIAEGAIIYVGNVNLSAVRTLEGNVELVSAFFTYENPSVERPISFEKPYTVAKGDGEATYWSMWDNSITLEDDGKILTDGNKGSLDGPSHDYVALNGLSGDGAYVKIVVDLGEAKNVGKFVAYTASNKGEASWGISESHFVRVKVSTDGETFTEAGYNENGQTVFSGTGADATWNSYESVITLEEAVSARYVEFDLYNNGSFCWVEEVEVWEGEEPVSTETSIDGEFNDSIWDDAVWTEYDGYHVGTWQQYQKKGTYKFNTALVEDDEYIYFAGIVDSADVTQIRVWFRTNPEAALYTHFIDVYSDGRSWIKKNQSLTDNTPKELEAKFEYALVEEDGVTCIEIKVAKSDLDIDGDYEFIPQAAVDGFSNLLGAEIIHGNFEFGGKTMTYFPWVHWPALPEEDYVGLIPVTNHWIFSDIPNDGEVGVISKAHYERQEDGSLRFVVGGTAYWPCVTYYYEEAKVYNVERGTLNYKFTTDRCNTNITFIFEDAEGAVYSFPLANTALGLEEGQYDKGSGDIRPGTYEGTIALSDLVASHAYLNDTAFPEADATELKFTGIMIYACGITDPAGGVYVDDLSVTVEAAPEVNENVMDLGEVVTITGVTFTADNPDGLETVEILGSIDGVNYYRLNSEAAVTVTDGVATVNYAMANNNFRAFLNVRYIKVVGEPNVEGAIAITEAAEEDVVKGIAPQGPYTQTGLNTNGYGIVVWTAEDAPEGFGLNEKGVYTDHDKALNLNSCMITIAEEVGEGVYKILWNDSNGWSKETGAAHLNTPEGVAGVDYRDGKVYLGENQIVMFIMSSGGYNTAGDGEFSTAKWILRGIVSGGFLKLGEGTVELYAEEPEAVEVDPRVEVADFDGDGKISSDDAIYLLRATLFAEDYPINVKAPFYGDKKPSSDDAIYLLRATLFPKDYPLVAE